MRMHVHMHMRMEGAHIRRRSSTSSAPLRLCRLHRRHRRHPRPPTPKSKQLHIPCRRLAIGGQLAQRPVDRRPWDDQCERGERSGGVDREDRFSRCAHPVFRISRVLIGVESPIRPPSGAGSVPPFPADSGKNGPLSHNIMFISGLAAPGRAARSTAAARFTSTRQGTIDSTASARATRTAASSAVGK